MPKYTVEKLSGKDLDWFVNTACVNMLTYELGKPEFVNIDNLYLLSDIVGIAETAFIAKQDGVCVGAIAGMLTPNLYNPNIKTLAELMWYVLPEYRETRAGLLLLNAFIERADQVADECSLSLLGTSKVNNSTLEKKGFKLMESGFWRGK